jgi:hypothetical protein
LPIRSSAADIRFSSSVISCIPYPLHVERRPCVP